jgi:hypothetical protein
MIGSGHEVNIPLRKFRRELEDNIKMNLKEYDMMWTRLT